MQHIKTPTTKTSTKLKTNKGQVGVSDFFYYTVKSSLFVLLCIND